MGRLVAKLLPVALAALLLLQAPAAHAKVFIALNYRITFFEDGTVEVVAKLHPFDVYGRSLIGNATIVGMIAEREADMVREMLLFFTDEPGRVRHKIISHIHFVEEEEVFCDIYKRGEMERLGGALLIAVLLQLNTTDAVRRVDGDVYEVRIRDFYTSKDPRSWIDVLNLTFHGATLLDYSYLPEYAKGPAAKGADSILWLNLNEKDAPDSYVVVLRIPGLVLRPREYRPEIVSAELKAGVVTIRVRNAGQETEIFTVAANGQARNIQLGPGEQGVVLFRVGGVELVRVEVWKDGVKLVEREFAFAADPSVIVGHALAGLALALLALSAVLRSLKRRGERHEAAENPPRKGR